MNTTEANVLHETLTPEMAYAVLAKAMQAVRLELHELTYCQSPLSVHSVRPVASGIEAALAVHLGLA